MPIYWKYQNESRGYLRGRVGGSYVIYHLTGKAESELSKAGVHHRHPVPSHLFRRLHQSGEIYSSRPSRPSAQEDGLFLRCDLCRKEDSNQSPLRIVVYQDNERENCKLLCRKCRNKYAHSEDFSIHWKRIGFKGIKWMKAAVNKT